MVELENAGGKIVGISAMEKVDKDGLTLLLLKKNGDLIGKLSIVTEVIVEKKRLTD